MLLGIGIYLIMAGLTAWNTYLDNEPSAVLREDVLSHALLTGALWLPLSMKQHVDDLAGRL